MARLYCIQRLLTYFAVGICFAVLAAIARGDEIDDYLEAQMRWRRIPGLSLAITQRSELVKARGYGLANLETMSPATTETIYKIGSLSKQFLAAAATLLAQQGKLDLDAPVTAYLPEAPTAWKAIVIRNLLNHTSGLPRESEAFNPFRQQPPMEVIESVFDDPLRFAPGEKWDYSNIGYYVLAEIVARVAEQPWESYILNAMLRPAGLNSTVSADPSLIVMHRASGYETRGGRLRNAEVWQAVRPSGGFATNVLDLAKWINALDSDELPFGSLRDQMLSPAFLSDGSVCPYGFGWFVDGAEGARRARHDGGVPGFVSDLEWYVDDSVVVVVLANIGERDLGPMARHLAGVVMPKLRETPEPSIPDRSPEVTDRLRKTLRELAGGVVSENAFTPQLGGWLREDLGNGFDAQLHGLGPIQSIELLDFKTEEKGEAYRYRCNYRHVILFVDCLVDRAGKFARFAIDS